MLDNKDVPSLQVTKNWAILFNEGGEGGRRQQFRRYIFDHVFDDTSTQEIVYQQTCAPLVREVISGKSAAVFAYGSTGSGEFSIIKRCEKL